VIGNILLIWQHCFFYELWPINIQLQKRKEVMPQAVGPHLVKTVIDNPRGAYIIAIDQGANPCKFYFLLASLVLDGRLYIFLDGLTQNKP